MRQVNKRGEGQRWRKAEGESTEWMDCRCQTGLTAKRVSATHCPNGKHVDVTLFVYE